MFSCETCLFYNFLKKEGRDMKICTENVKKKLSMITTDKCTNVERKNYRPNKAE